MDTPIGPQNIEWPVIKAQETTGKIILHRHAVGVLGSTSSYNLLEEVR